MVIFVLLMSAVVGLIHYYLYVRLVRAPEFGPSIQRAFEGVLARYNLKLGQLAQPVRVALTGGTVSPGIYEVIAVLGADRTATRLRAAIDRI